jgi:hypothetical protein
VSILDFCISVFVTMKPGKEFVLVSLGLVEFV